MVFTAVQLVYNPFLQFVPQAQLYSQLRLSLQSDTSTLGVPTSTVTATDDPMHSAELTK